MRRNSEWRVTRNPSQGRAALHRLLPVLLAGIFSLGLANAAFAQAELRTYQTKYYVLRTDLDEETVKEVDLRMTLMAEEYHRRTSTFSRTINERLPFYLFKEAEDYHAAGGMPGSAGVFMGDKLMAMAGGEKPGPWTWHIIQHEGFHQFVHATIGEGIPPWANEGLAEYFGESVFAGDQFFVGLIPPERLKRVQAAMKNTGFVTLEAMMAMSPDMWNVRLTGANYDQAWSMVHFLAHAENGKYQNAFAAFLKEMSRGSDAEKAWQRNFGGRVDQFEQRWRDYWLNLPENPTEQTYAQATIAILTSFYARAFSQRQIFEKWEDFEKAAREGQLKAHKDDWLPPALLEAGLRHAPQTGKWSIRKAGGKRELVCEMSDGTKLTGTFTIGNQRVKGVTVTLRAEKKTERSGRN